MAAVLIVDDDAAMRDALAEAVRDLGHDARLATSGEPALEMLDREAVSAVLLDLRMSGMDGLEVLRRIRVRPYRPSRASGFRTKPPGTSRAGTSKPGQSSGTTNWMP